MISWLHWILWISWMIRMMSRCHKISCKPCKPVLSECWWIYHVASRRNSLEGKLYFSQINSNWWAGRFEWEMKNITSLQGVIGQRSEDERVLVISVVVWRSQEKIGVKKDTTRSKNWVLRLWVDQVTIECIGKMSERTQGDRSWRVDKLSALQRRKAKQGKELKEWSIISKVKVAICSQNLF